MKSIKSTLLAAIKLTRINNKIGYLLLFFPAFFGLCLKTKNAFDILEIFPKIFFGSIVIRSAGCIINDIFDKDIDKNVTRTKDRPLANGSISLTFALILLIILLSIGLYILLQLSKTSIIIGFCAVPLILIYPLTKRITHFPQFFLAITFNLGVLIAYASVSNSIGYDAILLYIGCCFWTIGYDTVYGFSDIESDKKIGVKSFAIFISDKNYKLIISLCYTLFFIFFLLARITSIKNLYLYIIYLSCFLFYEILLIKRLDISNPDECIIFFKNQEYVGIALSALSLFHL